MFYPFPFLTPLHFSPCLKKKTSHHHQNCHSLQNCRCRGDVSFYNNSLTERVIDAVEHFLLLPDSLFLEWSTGVFSSIIQLAIIVHSIIHRIASITFESTLRTVSHIRRFHHTCHFHRLLQNLTDDNIITFEKTNSGFSPLLLSGLSEPEGERLFTVVRRDYLSAGLSRKTFEC